MADGFRIQHGEVASPGALLRLEGRLDARNAQVLVQECQRLRDEGRTNIVLNLANATFVASSGVGSLLALTELLKDVGGRLVLVEVSDAVNSVIELLNLTQFLNIAATESEALQTIGA